MSCLTRKIEKQIDKLRVPPLITPQRIPVLLGDSKGFNLQNQVRVNPESFIRFWCEAGASVQNRLQYLKDNLKRELETLKSITLFVWVGTCNLTTKVGDYIYLSSKDSTSVDDLKQGLKDIYQYTRQFGDQVKIIFLVLPLYSILTYNIYNEYEGDLTKFVEDDIILKQQIDEVNHYIEESNRLFHAISPKFSEDLLKSKRRSPFSHTKHKYDFSLYRDGIHPVNILAKLWLVRITKLVKLHCY